MDCVCIECPICLESIDTTSASDSFFHWPTCKHVVHTTCALTAAQYDVRCPMCRNLDNNIRPKQIEESDIETDDDEEESFLDRVERMITEHERDLRNYKSKRYRLIRNDDRLRKIQSKLQDAEKTFKTDDKLLDTEWVALQKSMWNAKRMKQIREKRKISQRRVAYFQKQLKEKVEQRIGTPPEPMQLTIE